MWKKEALSPTPSRSKSVDVGMTPQYCGRLYQNALEAFWYLDHHFKAQVL
jgi:hypothetical protein